MKKRLLSIVFLFTASIAFSQAREGSGDGYKEYYIITISKDGEVLNTFKEGKGIKGKIGEKAVDGVWYFKAAPDVVTVIGLKGKVLGDLKLNEQKNLKLETDVPKSSNGIGVGIGIGPVGISTGGSGGGPRFIGYNMDKHEAVFSKQKETREEKIKREYAEKLLLEKEKKALAKQAKKDKKKFKKKK